MIFPIIVAMPGEDDREDGPRSQHFSKKDLRWALPVIAFAVVALVIGYRYFKKQSDEHVCVSNMNSIFKAVSLYANDWDDRFPPIAWESNSLTGDPMINGG